MITRKHIKEFLEMVEDAKDRLTGLAKELGANHHRVEWSMEDDGSEQLEFKCRIQCTFGEYNNYHCGSYVSSTHPFEEAERSVREMHSKWLLDEAKRGVKRAEERVKDELYAKYMAERGLIIND